MSYSQEFSPLSMKEEIFFQNETESTSLEQQLQIANEKVIQLMQYQQQLSEELEHLHYKYRETQQENEMLSNQLHQGPDEAKFLNCVLDMVRVCHPQDKPITLKYAWKWLKYVVDDYIELRKRTKSSNTQSEVFKNPKKNSIVVGDLLRKNCQVAESQYIKNSKCHN
ncbi:unnamed protein product [Paramecium octaurelia]|uniref:Uncharacterized protein n=1 Tax=Paramecium octaurelia TaxID=43137 RepID=A0A8S1SFD9_PAROT|nr:unnamed protein product [Paramecium octaurelia]